MILAAETPAAARKILEIDPAQRSGLFEIAGHKTSHDNRGRLSSFSNAMRMGKQKRSSLLFLQFRCCAAELHS